MNAAVQYRFFGLNIKAAPTPAGFYFGGGLRGYLPRVRSMLMDEETLLAHRALWVTEPQPHRADAVEHLHAAEQALYRDLRGDRWGVRVRLEQERIAWDFAWRRIVGAA